MENLTFLKSLVETRSDTNCDDICKLLIQSFTPYASEIITLGKNNLIIGINTTIKNSSPIILSGHIDTVKADENQYKTNPYTLTIENNKAIGLGVIDMKCFFASIYNNVETIKKLNSPVVLCITSDEETKFDGILEICDKLKKLNVSPKFVIIGEPTDSFVMTAAKGCFEYQLQVIGKPCHSSTPTLGINSIYIASKFISFVEELNKTLSFTTLNVGIISGGKMTNQVPAECSLTFDIRTINELEFNKVQTKITEFLENLETEYEGSKIILTKILNIKPLFNKLSTKYINIIKKLNLNFGEFPGGCEAGYFQEFCDDVILFGAGELSQAHKPNESLNLENFETYNKTFLQLLSKIDELNKK